MCLCVPFNVCGKGSAVVAKVATAKNKPFSMCIAMKILIVDDEKQLTSALSMLLKKRGFECDCVYDGEDALEYALTGVYDAVALDWMLPKLSGIEVLERLRAKGIATPVIMLTAKGEVADKISGLNCGADDYLSKPFNSDELVARIYAITRRKGDYVGMQIKFGDVTLDCESHVLACGGQSVKLGAKEFQVLEMLLKNPERVFPKELIIDKIWGYDSDAEYNNVEVYVSFIRRKLTAIKSHVTIKSIRNTGYRAEVDN